MIPSSIHMYLKDSNVILLDNPQLSLARNFLDPISRLENTNGLTDPVYLFEDESSRAQISWNRRVACISIAREAT